MNIKETATVFLGTISAYGEVLSREGGLTKVRFGKRVGDVFIGKELAAA